MTDAYRLPAYAGIREARKAPVNLLSYKETFA